MMWGMDGDQWTVALPVLAFCGTSLLWALLDVVHGLRVEARRRRSGVAR